MLPHLAILVPHISTTRLLIWCLLFIIYLEHSPSLGNSGSFIYLKHAPSFGHSGSTYILNTPPLRRFQSIMYLKHAPSFGDSDSSCIYNTSHTQWSHDGFQERKLMHVEASLHCLKGGCSPPALCKQTARMIGSKNTNIL